MQLYVPNKAMMMDWQGQRLNLVPGQWPRVPEGHKIIKAHPDLFDPIEVSPGFELPASRAKAGASA